MAFKRDEVHPRYRSSKQKVLVSLVFLIIFILLSYILAHLFRTGADMLLIGIVILIMILLIPIAIFVIDLILYEFE